jgi:hypothetical protein
MSIEGIVVGLLGIVLGAVFCFAGFRWFLLLLPIWGLFVGFMAGASAVSLLLGEGFLAGVLGIVVGVVFAVIFALLSWFYWWGAVALVGGVLGYTVALGLLAAIGFNADGFLTAIIAIAAGVAVAVVALLINAPKYVAIILTAFAGAAWLTAGIALALGIIKTSELGKGPLAAVYLQGWFWILIWAVVAGAGIIAQIQMTRAWEQDLIVSYDSRRPF